jgi:hypothetical protein
MISQQVAEPGPRPFHHGKAGKDDDGPPGVADQPAQEEDEPITAGHAAEAAAPQIHGHDEGIELIESRMQATGSLWRSSQAKTPVMPWLPDNSRHDNDVMPRLDIMTSYDLCYCA